MARNDVPLLTAIAIGKRPTFPFLRKSLRPFQLRLTSGRGACILCAVDIH